MKRWILQTSLFAIIHYLLLLSMGGLAFLLAHFPPRFVSFDPVILLLAAIEKVLVSPRLLMRWLWPGETSPGWLNLTLTLLNSLAWGAALAFVARLRRGDARVPGRSR